MPSRIYSMAFNTSSTLLCVSSATDTVHIFKLSHQGSSPVEGSPSSLTARDRRFNQSTSSTLPDEDDMVAGEISAPDFPSRKPNGTLMGMIRRTSQSVGSSVAARVGEYLPKGVSEMWEPARDFAWVKIPKSGHGTGHNGGHTGPLRSVVAMSSNSPQVMVVTSDGNFYVFNIDLSRGGEGTLTKQYSWVDRLIQFQMQCTLNWSLSNRVLDTNERLGYPAVDYWHSALFTAFVRLFCPCIFWFISHPLFLLIVLNDLFFWHIPFCYISLLSVFPARFVLVALDSMSIFTKAKYYFFYIYNIEWKLYDTEMCPNINAQRLHFHEYLITCFFYLFYLIFFFFFLYY